MERAGNNLNIIILDACRNNPFARSFRSAEKGLAKMDAPTGSILAYATAPGSVAADGSGRNGLYTAKLLKRMIVPGLEIGRLFREVRKDVVKASGKKQTPWESSSLMGDFYFKPKKTGSSLEIDGGGWRMPTKEEILTLYKNGPGTKNMTPLLTNSSWWVWFKKSGFDIGGRGAGAYNFYLGPNDYKSYKPSSFNRAFAVRNRK